MLAAIAYVPILRSKVAEVTAYRNLSEGVKAQTLPLFLARPWPNANFLDLTTNKLSEAAAGHPFAIGLDGERRNFASGKPAQSEFNSLFEPRAGFRAFYDWTESQANAVPVLQSANDSTNILLQLGHADRIGRGLVVHVTSDKPLNVLTAAGSVPPLPHDTIFVIDAGWGRNYELLEAWVAPIVGRIISIIPEAEIVVAASSFPDSFSNIIGHSEVLAHEFRLFQSTRQRFNQANLTYGDWGSTRPSQSGGGGKIPPRIDIPVGARWNVFRADPDGDEDYGDVASAAARHICFTGVPECFGKQMVENTPGEGGITGPAKGTEARINMHMTICSDAANTLDSNEAPYED